LFAEKVFACLLESEHIDQDSDDSMNSWKHSGFNFFAGEPIGAEDKDAVDSLLGFL
jgi:hypothetical protein